MSKLNECHVYGIINMPKFDKNEKGEIVAAMFTVHTVRRKSGAADVEELTGTDEILFFTKEEDKIKTLQHIENVIKKADKGKKFPVECFGSLVTRKVDGQITCNKCGHSFDSRTYYSYIRPTVINLYGEALNYGERINFLKRMREKSNSITLIGNVSSNVFSMQEMENIEEEDNVFSVAIKRNYPLIEDPMNDTDFPLVTAKTLNSELPYLQKGSSLLIRGSVWLKKMKKSDTCPKCAHVHEYSDDVTIIFPYNVEFLFSSKNRYAFGAAIKSFDDKLCIRVTLKDEPLCTINSIEALKKDEYEDIRKNLYPRVIRKIVPISSDEILIDVEDSQILDMEESKDERI